MGFKKMTSDPRKIGRGRFLVSEGIAPSEHILPDEDLATLYSGMPGEGDEFFEAVLLQGTIVGVYQKTDGRYVATYCRGLSGYTTAQAILTTATGAIAYETVGHAAGDGEVDLGVVFVPDTTTIIDNTPNTMGETGVNGVAGSLGQAAKPIGVLAKDAFRPFDKGDNEGINFVTHGFVEWPLVEVHDDDNNVVFDNTALKVGCFVKSDALGRPVKWNPGEPEDLKIAQVIAREDLLANGPATGVPVDYDYGMLEWMRLPYDVFNRALVKKPYEVTVFGQASKYFGVRPNYDGTDFATMADAYQHTVTTDYGVVGAVRANLINL